MPFSIPWNGVYLLRSRSTSATRRSRSSANSASGLHIFSSCWSKIDELWRSCTREHCFCGKSIHWVSTKQDNNIKFTCWASLRNSYVKIVGSILSAQVLGSASFGPTVGNWWSAWSEKLNKNIKIFFCLWIFLSSTLITLSITLKVIASLIGILNG